MAVPTRSLSRRALFGLRSEPTRAIVSIADHCLAYREIACETCADACETQAIQFHRTGRVRRPLIDTSACTGCESCVEVCPAGALNIQKPPEVNT
jgi:ferredoxin-type protein NapF